MKRIDWVDYYKALAIILVVLGHTGQFNGIIYQFQVAAFFFISGFVAKLEKKELDEVIILKFFSLLLPYIFFATWLYTIFAVLQQFGVLGYVSMWESIPGWFSNIVHMFNAPYGDWLGTMWFLKSLFIATIMAKAFLIADKNRCGIIFFGLFMFAYLMGYFYHDNEYSPIFVNSFDHYLVVQVYFCLGILLRWIYEHVKIKIPGPVIAIVFIASAAGIYVFQLMGLKMDLASMFVNGSKKDLLMACNGILFLTCASVLISYIPSERFKKAVQYVGQNTMGILIFHLIGFKLVTLCLFAFGVCDFAALAEVVPPTDITNTWWPLYLVGTTAFSLAVWALINRSRHVRFFTGLSRESYKKIYTGYRALYEEK